MPFWEAADSNLVPLGTLLFAKLPHSSYVYCELRRVIASQNSWLVTDKFFAECVFDWSKAWSGKPVSMWTHPDAARHRFIFRLSRFTTKPFGKFEWFGAIGPSELPCFIFITSSEPEAVFRRFSNGLQIAIQLWRHELKRKVGSESKKSNETNQN